MSLSIFTSPDPCAVLLDGWRRGEPVLRVRWRKSGGSVRRFLFKRFITINIIIIIITITNIVWDVGTAGGL